jgi:putative tryptophan/tyrosine transport system substrate-binding protein
MADVVLYEAIMQRRDFITFLGGALAWPIGAHAQQPAMPVIGFLSGGSPTSYAHLVAAFREGLGETGYVEGRNVKIEYRWAEGSFDRLKSLAADLVERRVSLIAATGGSNSVIAAKSATKTIPIVFTGGGDPVKLGFVASLSRPGGNATGITNLSSTLETKRVELLGEIIPKAARIAALINPSNPNAEVEEKDLQSAGNVLGRNMLIVQLSNEANFDQAFMTVLQAGIGALVVVLDPFFRIQRDRLVELAAQHRLPAMYSDREFAVAGGLMSYGANISTLHRQVGIYAGRILKGEKPSELPVVQPTKFELVINLKTARALGLDIPAKVLALADEVIE